MNTRFANHWDHSQSRAAMLLDPTVTNLNTGSFGPLPKVVFERVTELRQRLAEEPMDFLLREMPGHLWQRPRTAGEFLARRPAPPDLHRQRDGGDQPRRVESDAWPPRAKSC